MACNGIPRFPPIRHFEAGVEVRNPFLFCFSLSVAPGDNHVGDAGETGVGKLQVLQRISDYWTLHEVHCNHWT